VNYLWHTPLLSVPKSRFGPAFSERILFLTITKLDIPPVVSLDNDHESSSGCGCAQKVGQGHHAGGSAAFQQSQASLEQVQ